MSKKYYINKIISLILIINFIFWFGIYISRNLVLFQLFEPENLALKKLFYNVDLNYLFSSLYPLFISHIFLFISFVLLFILFISLTELKFKENGWLLITTLIIFITAPFEFYLILYDYKIVNLILKIPETDYNQILFLIKERLTILSNFTLIEIFSYLIVIYLVIFKPLKK